MRFFSISLKNVLTASVLTFFLLSIASFSVRAGSQGTNKQVSSQKNSEGWFYIGKFNHNTNSFEKSYFNTLTYPVLGQRLIAKTPVNMRDSRPTQGGKLGKKIGIILKNYVLIATKLAKVSTLKGFENVWIKGYIGK